MKQYNQRNCQSCVRSVHKIGNIQIIVAGQYAFKYSVTIKRQNKTSKSLIFANRELAIKELFELKKQYKMFGDCNFHY